NPAERTKRMWRKGKRAVLKKRSTVGSNPAIRTTTRSTTAVRRAYTSQVPDRGVMQVRLLPGGPWWTTQRVEHGGCEPLAGGFESPRPPHWAKCYGCIPASEAEGLGSIPSAQTI